MRKYNYIHNPEELLEEGRKIVTSSAYNKYVHRVEMVNLILAGMPLKDISACSGDSLKALQNWVRSVDENGWDSLIAKKQTGRPKILTSQQEAEIKELLKKDPQEYGYDKWDGSTLSEYIKKKYDVVYGIRACQKLMHDTRE